MVRFANEAGQILEAYSEAVITLMRNSEHYTEIKDESKEKPATKKTK